MTDTAPTPDVRQAVARLVRFLSVEGVTGHEAAIGREVADTLAEAGVPRGSVRFEAWMAIGPR